MSEWLKDNQSWLAVIGFATLLLMILGLSFDVQKELDGQQAKYVTLKHFYHYNDMQSVSIDVNRTNVSINRSNIARLYGMLATKVCVDYDQKK